MVQRAKPLRKAKLDEVLARRMETIIQEHPTFGYRRIWALLRTREGVRVLKVKGWLVHQRRSTPRPRVKASRSFAESSNQRWAMDVTPIPCGEDGCAHLTAVIDCHDREVIGYELSLHGRAKEAERAIEADVFDGLTLFGLRAMRPSCAATTA